ncbi:MAG: hypothetical protein F6J89_08135 [Symploca sp. SIO1C4]|uniref:Uncharacterized protein n=1 Tax=Symploca sp. SIO1C4 TaxID=2607765 RepID=A0A6B3ND81_9CYAN|nr:hypothetical protein [Symploca sp. SIO1C4]
MNFLIEIVLAVVGFFAGTASALVGLLGGTLTASILFLNPLISLLIFLFPQSFLVLVPPELVGMLGIDITVLLLTGLLKLIFDKFFPDKQFLVGFIVITVTVYALFIGNTLTTIIGFVLGFVLIYLVTLVGKGMKRFLGFFGELELE